MRARRTMRIGFWLVFVREWRQLGRRPFLLMLSTIVPLSLMGLLTGVFSAGLATNLAVGVVDLDGSELSRTIVRTVDATPDVAIVNQFGELGEGRHAILAGEVRGLLMLPRNLERDVQAGRRPEVVFFYNTQTMTSGNLVLRAVNAAIPSVAAGIRLSLRTAHGQPLDAALASLQPIPVQVHTLFNPALNYVHFLLAALLPSVLQVVIVATSAYCVALDVETSHRLRVLRRLGGGLWPAVAGKLLPYTILFLMVLAVSDAVLFGVLELPLRGSRTLLVLADVLFIASCQLMGALLGLLLRPVGTAISIATLMTAPAFGFMGVGFPRLGMNAFAYSWGGLLPGTWYLATRIDQTVRGTPLDLSWQPVLVLMGFVIVLGGLLALCLERLRTQKARIPAALASVGAPT